MITAQKRSSIQYTTDIPIDIEEAPNMYVHYIQGVR